MRALMPILEWLPAYRRAWLAGDLAAGAAVWAVLVPLALAYAGLLGVDPVVGLYALPLPLVAYAIFGGSRLFVVGPDAAVVVLAAATVAGVAAAGERLPLILALTLLIGALYVALFLLKVGWIADLIPDPVLKGFVEGAIWVTILKQLPGLLGLEVDAASGQGLERLAVVVRALPEAHLATALLALACVAALWLLRRFASRLPGPLVVLAASTFVVWLLGLDRAGVAVVGAAGVDAPGFGAFALPGLDSLVDLLPGALAIVVLGYTKSLGALKRAHDIHNPTIAVVGRTPSGAFVDVDQHSGAAGVPGMLILRQYAPLVFLNARVLSSEMKRLALGHEGLRVVVLDATSSSGIDSTAAEAFRAARDDLTGAGIELWVVNAREEGWKVVVATLNAAGATIPPTFESLADAVSSFELGGGDASRTGTGSRLPGLRSS